MRQGTRRTIVIVAVSAALVACGGDEYFVYRAGPTGGSEAPNHAPEITLVFVAPLETDIGFPITLSGAASDADGDPVTLRWAARNGFGTIADTTAPDTTYTCKKKGPDTIVLIVSDGRTERTAGVPITCS